MSVLVLRIVRTKDVAMRIAFQDHYSFTQSTMAEDAMQVRGSELLKATVAWREPMASNLVRFDARQRRVGVVSAVLDPVASKVLRPVNVAFEVKWDAQSMTRKTQRLETVVTSRFPRNAFREDFQFISRRRRLGATRAAALDRNREVDEEEKAGEVEKADV